MKIMQCWDDGVVNDVPLCELLRKYCAKATFNLNPGLCYQDRRKICPELHHGKYCLDKLSLDEMKDVYAGFKIGGHTMTHPNLPDLDAETMKRELEDNKAIIADFFGQEHCGMAYPCGRYDDAVKQAVKDAGYLYSRTTKNVDGLLNLDDPMALHSHCHFMNPDFWAKYEKIRELDGVFYFWGHSYEMMEDEALWDEFESKIERISSDSQAEWIDIVDLFV